MPSKSEPQVESTGGAGKSGGEEWGGGKSGVSGGAGVGGIASLISGGDGEQASRSSSTLSQKTLAQAAGARQSPALPQNMAALLNSSAFALDPEAYLERLPANSPLRAQAEAYLSTTPGYYTGQPMTPQQIYAPVTSPIGGSPQFTAPAAETLYEALVPQQQAPSAPKPYAGTGQTPATGYVPTATAPSGPNGYAPQLLPGVGFNFGTEAPAAMRGQLSAFPQTGPVSGPVPFSMGTPVPLAPGASPAPPQRPAQVEVTANAYPWEAVLAAQAEQYNALPPEVKMAGMETAPIMQSQPFVEPTPYLPAQTYPTSGGTTPAGLQQGFGFAPSALSSIGGQATPPTSTPSAQQPMTPQQVYGGLTSNIGFSAPPQAQLPYGPPSRPANAPAMVQAPAAAPLQYGPESFQYANAADPFTISETMAMLGEGQTQAPVAAPAPAPAQPQMSTQEIAQNAAATSGTMPVTSYPVPTGSAVPGGGIMAGIQEALGAFGLGNLGLGNLNLGDFADTRTSEERLADFVSSQAEMSQGDDRTPVAPMFDDSGNSLPGSNGGDTTTPTPPPVITPYVPNIPAPYYTPSTLSPYVPATAPANPVYGYSSYNALQQAMGMAQGGAVGPSMTNAFAPGTYYARYNPYARGLGALRKG